MKKVCLLMLLVCFSSAFCQTYPPLVYTNQKFQIELTTSPDGKKCILERGKINVVVMNTHNFDTRVMTCSGPGLRFLKPLNPEQTTILWEVNLTNWEANKPYLFFFNYNGRKTQFSGKFEIPVQ